MFCSHCGNEIKEDSLFCKYCGAQTGKKNDFIYVLQQNEQRTFQIEVHQQEFIISGDYMEYINKDLKKRKQSSAAVPVNDFLGIGLFKERSYSKMLWIMVFSVIISIVSQIFSKYSDRQDLFEVFFVIFAILALISLVLVLLYAFSKKDVIEISFTTRHICIPRKSITDEEYGFLYRALKEASKMQ